jgi:glutamyl-tRNA reductase
MEHSAREVAPIVSALHAQGEVVRAAELERYRGRLDQLDPSAREAVEALTRGIVKKLLHEPTVRVKGAAGTARGELYADALAELFDLTGPPAPPDQ